MFENDKKNLKFPLHIRDLKKLLIIFYVRDSWFRDQDDVHKQCECKKFQYQRDIETITFVTLKLKKEMFEEW